MSKGVEAAEHCDDFGWKPVGQIDPSLVAETLQQPRYGVGRAWSNAARYELTRAPNRIYLVHTVEGGFECTVNGSTSTSLPGQLMLFDGSARTSVRSVAATARFVWYFEPVVLELGKSRFEFQEPITLQNSYMRALTSVTNALLNTPLETAASVAALGHTGLALEHLVVAALAEHRSGRRGGVHGDGVFMTAQLVIEMNFRDPGFTVARLAKELSMSERSVLSAFRSLGTSPRRAIEQRRLEEVRRLQGQLLTMSQILELAGFSTTRTYRRALVRDSPLRRLTPETSHQ